MPAGRNGWSSPDAPKLELQAMNDRFSPDMMDTYDFDEGHFAGLGPLIPALGTLVGVVLALLMLWKF
jgi:hypothetical protein